jgi:hypothetical protein
LRDLSALMHNPKMSQRFVAVCRKLQDKQRCIFMATETKKAEVPPYIAFSTFMSFIKGLEATGIPSRIDKSLLRNMSGSNQSALFAALKWFDLIDDAGSHGKPLESLVAAGDEAGRVLKGMLPVAYKFMSDGSIDIGKATGAQIEEKFRAYGLSGATIVKAMAFFISACKEAGIQLSSHIKLPKVVRANGAAKAKKGRQPAEASDADLEGEDGLPVRMKAAKTGADALMEKFPAFDPAWPEKIQEQWFAAFAKMQDMVK